MIVLGNCTFKNRTTTTKMCLEDLDMNVQDTLRNLPVDSFGCHPDLIDLTGHYKLIDNKRVWSVVLCAKTNKHRNRKILLVRL